MNQSKALSTVLLVLLILGSGFYIWKMKIAKQEVLPTPEDLPIETPSDVSPRYPQHIVPIEGTDEVWYQIPELGIQMRMNREFAEDLVYECVGSCQDNGSGGVYLALKSEMEHETMDISDSDKSIAAIGKITGKVKDASGYYQSRYISPNYKNQFKHFEEFFLYYQTPIDNGNGCSSANSEETRIKFPNDLCIIFQTAIKL